MNKNSFSVAGALLAVFLLSGNILLAQSYLKSPNVSKSVSNSSQDLNYNTTKFKQTLYLIANGYLDTANISSLTEEAIKSVIAKLDPHSSYISAKDVQAMEEPLVGNFEGIGIEYAIIGDTLTVQSVIAGGPSEKAGLRAGDKINSVDGEVISGTGLTTERVIKYLRGPKGTKVRVGYLRRGMGSNEVVITRDKIPLNTVDGVSEVSDGILYIRITRFGAETYNEFTNAVSEYTSKQFENDKHFKGLIVDLRSNGGGYLSAAQRIANEFLSKGNLILYAEGRAVKRADSYADGSGKLQNIPLAILIDEASASASEIVSGAVQDWDRGVIVGRRSFGKGLVEQEYPLVDGSRIRLTIARYHTPSGRVIQTPYIQGDKDDYNLKFVNRLISEERYNKDSIKIDPSLEYRTLKLGRKVYGGGGIIPDEFIPLDTTYYSTPYLKSVNSGAFSEFVQTYADLHRENITSKYKSFEDFMNRYTVSDSFFNEYLEDSKKRDILFTESDLAKSQEHIKMQLKGLVIRNIYGLDNYLIYSNKTDANVLKAVEVLKKSAGGK